MGLALAVLATLCPLFLLKYLPWLLEASNTGEVWLLAGVEGRGVPPGLSFVTLQAVGYLVDIRRRTVEASRSLTEHTLFLAFFPQLVAGPIERTAVLRPQLESPKRPSGADYYGAVKLVLWGYAMKCVLADTLASPIETLLHLPDSEAPAGLLLALALFSCRLYLDFYAYSCIAVGLGRAHGVHLTMNFLHPFGAASLKAFWRRWHVSLSTWWRDYVYIPLGGSRRGGARSVFALLVVFLLSGIWHGPGVAFVAWGAFHGLGLLIEQLLRVLRPTTSRIRWPLASGSASIIKQLAVASFVSVGWLPFLVTAERPLPVLWHRLVRSLQDIDSTMTSATSLVAAHGAVLALALCTVAVAHRLEGWYWRDSPASRWRVASDVAITNLLLVSLLLLGDLGGRAFIYFAF